MNEGQERKLNEVHEMTAAILRHWDALAHESKRHGTLLEGITRDNRDRDRRILDLTDRVAALEAKAR